MMNAFKINGRNINSKSQPYIIAEVGINHNGEFKKAIQCVDAAIEAGADCVKFQCRIAEAEMIPSDITPGNISDEKQWDITKRCELTENEERNIKDYCEKNGITFLSTPFSREASDRLEKIGVSAFKIGSGECNNLPLLEHIARKKKPIILSTGMNNLSSIRKSVDIVKKYDCSLILLHCTSLYPTPYTKVRLGEPGTGKTLLAKAIAGEAAVPFFSISGSDFVEMFVGVGASRVRDMFAQGKKHAPCIIFIDEIDAVGRSRGAGLGGGNDEREQTLNQLLVEMDGFEVNEGIIVVAATNRPDVLDHALLRPGRFDRHVVVPSPDIKGRENILKTHSKNIELDKKVSLNKIARGTPGFTGADLANLVNEAALWAARQDKETVDNDDFEYARDKVMMGAERRSLLISDEEKETTAYHEVGHALVAASIEEVDPVHKVSIIPRGRALGVTMLLPEEDRHSHNKRSLLGQITMTMGGRAAEHLVFKRFTTGASDDLKRATELARKMVCQWGMSEKLGPLTYTEDAGHVFLGRDLQQHTEFSNESMRMIDEEVLEILNSSYERAKSILKTYRKALESLAMTLLEKETIDGENVLQVMEEFAPKTKK